MKQHKKLIWTRAASDWLEDQFYFEDKQNSVIHLPCLRLQAIDTPDVPESLAQKNPFVTVISSPKTIDYLYQRKPYWNLVEKNSQIFCFGEKTQSIAVSRGLKTIRLKQATTLEEMAPLIVELISKERLVFLPGGKKRAFDLDGFLKERGFQTERIDLYETNCQLRDRDEKPLSDAKRNQFIDQLAGVVCFASPSAVEGFAAVLEPQKNRLSSELVAVAIGKTSEKACKNFFDQVFVSPHPELKAFVEFAFTKI